MSEGLDATLVLPGTGKAKKPSVQYRTSPYTVEQYCALPYTERRAVDAACDERAGLSYTTYDDESSEKPYTVGRRTTTPSTPTLQPTSPMTAYVHPAPSPALHFLNTPELIAHDAAHPDNAHTSAVAATAPIEVSPRAADAEALPTAIRYDLATIVSRYVTLTPTEGDTDWTHWGTSPLVGGDTHSFAVNTDAGTYKCFTSGRAGRVVDFVMFMEELSEPEAVEWLETNYSSELSAPAEVVHPTGLPPAIEPEAVSETGTDGPACDYPYPRTASFKAMAEQVADATAPTPPAAPVAIEGTVYSTTDYDLFHLLPENRAIDRAVVRRLVEQIGRKNLLFVEPILVTADLGIIDGQHRREAARELGVPIFYKIAPELTEDDIAMLNSNKKNWLGTDYLHFWTVKGADSYVQLTAFRQRHPSIGFSNAKMMLSHPSAEMSLGEFRAGRWQVYQVEVADRVAELLERIKEEVGFKQAAQTRFVAAVYHIANVKGFDADRLMRKLNMQPRALRQQATHRQYLEMFDELYNYKTAKDNHLHFV